ncbi:hypothetical protein E2C01_031305 [Portunus trituberculatus]|uniref:Uncharacterized protein n=1 Tax=Portunus trituberculatus TaxID=210409 RepID=A0A5B7EU56_PORTR|nr:hypothetical protein [Portunus trituberculatus]
MEEETGGGKKVGGEEHEVISGESQRFLRDVTTPSRGHVTRQPPSLFRGGGRESRERSRTAAYSVRRHSLVTPRELRRGKKCDDYESVGFHSSIDKLTRFLKTSLPGGTLLRTRLIISVALEKVVVREQGVPEYGPLFLTFPTPRPASPRPAHT